MKKSDFQRLFKILAWSGMIIGLLSTFLFAQAEKAQSPTLTPPQNGCSDDQPPTSQKTAPSLTYPTPQSQEKGADSLNPSLLPITPQAGREGKG